MRLYCPNLENHDDGHRDTEEQIKCYKCKSKGYYPIKIQSVIYIPELNFKRPITLPAYTECNICSGCGYVAP